MSKYELAVVVSAKLEDDARAEVIEKVKALVTRFGGNITDVDEWGKKRLAYEIQKMKEGFYYFIQFEADATCPAEVERHVRIMDNVMRYLVVKKEAYYYFIHFESETTTPGEIEERIRIMDGVIRYLCVKQEA